MKNKTHLYIVFIISLIFIKCESYQTEYLFIVKCPQLKTIKGITQFNGKIFTGSCNMLEDDIVYELKSFKNGVPHGVHKRYYYPTDKLDYVGYRKNGHIHGPFTKYHQNGNIAATGQFRRGIYSGKWMFYDEKGQLVEERSYGATGNIIKNNIK